MDNGFIEEGWKPEPQAQLGSERWKDDIAFQYALKCFDKGFLKSNIVIKVPDFGGYAIGYFCLEWKLNGWNYFRVSVLFTGENKSS